MADESPLDRFKSALTGASRALAREPELEVSWTAEAPAEVGKTLRVPMPGRDLPRHRAMEARGVADSFALKLRHHDPVLHKRGAPADASARACFDAIETVRYEALGSRDYAGIRGNIDAANAQRLSSDPITRATRADEVPVEAALSLLLRERLSGEPVPEAAHAGVAMVRNWIEGQAGGDLDALVDSIGDQSAFQSLTLDLLRHLEMVEQDDASLDETDADDEEGEEDGEQDDESDDDGSDQDTPGEIAGETGEGEEDGETDTQPGDMDEMGDAEAGDEGEEGMLPVRPNRPWTELPKDFEYKVFTSRFDEVIAARELCDDEELARLRAYLDTQLTGLQGVVTRLANRLQRRLWRSRTGAGISIRKRGCWMRRGWRGSWLPPDIRSPTRSNGTSSSRIPS